MVQSKKKPRPRKKAKKPAGFFNIKKVFLFFFLTMLVVVSIFAAGYVIFFRTVFAAEIPIGADSTIVFEEPDPPIHEEPISDRADVDAHPDKELPKVAIIIDDLGYHEHLGDQLLNSSIEMSYSFLPFAPYTGKQEKIAFISGKTVLLHLPLEPKDSHWDPGPGALLLSDSSELQEEKFEQALAAVPHAMGVNTHMGSLYTEDTERMRGLVEEVGAYGLFFIDSFTTAESKGLLLARECGLKCSRRHVFLDNVLDQGLICDQLEKLVEFAEKKSFAIGIGHPHRVTYRALEECVPLYSGRVEFVAVTDVL